MIIYPKDNLFNDTLNGTFYFKPEVTNLGDYCIGFSGDLLLFISWANTHAMWWEHNVILNSNRKHILVGEFKSLDDVVSALIPTIAKGRNVLKLRSGLAEGDNHQSSVPIHPEFIQPLLQMLTEIRVSGEEVEKSLRIIYGADIPFRITRIYLNGGIKVQSRMDSQSDYEELVSYLLSTIVS